MEDSSETGDSLGSRYAEALTSAVYDALHRDAFTMWPTKAPAPVNRFQHD